MDESLSKVPVRIRVMGVGEADGELVRFMAPLTVQRLLRRLPLKGRAHPIEGGISVIVGIRKGEEKSVREVEAGTMAYWPRGDALCIFHSDAVPMSPVNRIGAVSGDLGLFKDARSGSRIIIEKA